MKPTFALLLAGGLLATLASCDYHNSPGKDPQVSQDFTPAVPARAMEINRDSITGRQDTYTPIGRGSAADQKTSVDAALDGAPNNASSPVGDMPSSNPEVTSTARESD